MAKSGVQYADDVRELRAQGVEFPAALRGYILADAANWTSGQKAAVTRTINLFDFTAFDRQQEAQEKVAFKRRSEAAKKGAITRRRRITREALPEAAPEVGLDSEIIADFFDDAVGDADEEWDDIFYLDFDEADELTDEENDTYDETPA